MRLHLPAPTRKELGANKHLAGAFLALSAVGPYFLRLQKYKKSLV